MGFLNKKCIALKKMKKTILFLVAVTFFWGCEKVDEPILTSTSPYTIEQQKSLAVLKGQFKCSQGYSFEFTKVFSAPIDFYEDDLINGKVLTMRAHGECIYKTSYSLDSLYFVISLTAESITLYYKGGKKDKELNNIYNIDFDNANQFTLWGTYQNDLVYIRQ